MKRKILILISVFIILDIVDYFITLWGVGHGLQELNFLVNPLSWMYPLVKIVCPLLIILFLVRWGYREPKPVIISLVTISLLQGAVVIYQVYGLTYYLHQI